MTAVKRTEKFKEFLIGILGTICLTYALLFFLDSANEIYQTLKDIYSAKAFFMLALFMFIAQRVRLFNWQSLVAILLYTPVGLAYRNMRAESPDLFARDKVVVWTFGILLLIVVDMIVYKKVNPLARFHNPSLILFSLMAVAMIFHRGDRTYPIIFIVMFLFYLIPLDKSRWRSIVFQISGVWMLGFGQRLIRSLQENPDVAANGRWYGCFLNIGDFGLFMAAVVTVCLFLLAYCKDRFGRKSVPYVFAWLLMIPVLWAALRVCTITMFIGIGFVLMMGLVILPKDNSKKAVIYRAAVLSAGLVILAIGGLITLKLMANTDGSYWSDKLLNGNPLIKPYANLVTRAHYMFNGSRTFSDCGIFEEGTLINAIDLFTSGRLSIIKVFSEHFNFTGNPSFGVQVGRYFAYSTHNAYTQVIFEYGYIAGGLFSLWFIYAAIAGGKRYLKEKRDIYLLPAVWFVMVLGVMTGEMVNPYSPVMVFALILAYPIMISLEEK